MTLPFDEAKSRLEAAGLETITFGHEGNTILALPSYGRVLGLWTDRQQPGFFWINEDFLADPGHAGDGWANPGGDRIWLGPERELFISDQADPGNSYVVPRSADPGRYRCALESATLVMDNEGMVRGFRSGVEVGFCWSRSIRALDPEATGAFPGLSSAGYEEMTFLHVAQPSAMPVCLWNLIQVPLGGQVLVPVPGDAPVTFFGSPGPAVQREKGLIRVDYSKSLAEPFKIGLRASDIRGTMLYLRPDGEGSELLVRTFDLGQDHQYIDVPWEHREGPGYALELFCGGSAFGFGELEFHSPAAGGPAGPDRCHVGSRIHAFRGPEAAIMELVETMTQPVG